MEKSETEQVKRLKTLNLEGTKLARMPKAIGRLPNLRGLNVDNQTMACSPCDKVKDEPTLPNLWKEGEDRLQVNGTCQVYY